MKVSGNTTSAAPARPASLINVQAFSVVASRSRNTGVAWTAAIRTNAPAVSSTDVLTALASSSRDPGQDVTAGVRATEGLPAGRWDRAVAAGGRAENDQSE